MKKFFHFLAPLNIASSWNTLRTRFPLPSVIALVITWLICYQISQDEYSAVIMRVVLSLITTFFLAIGICIYLETTGKKHLAKYQSIAILYGIWFFLTLNPSQNAWMIENMSYFMLHLVGFIAILFFAPYISGTLYRKDRSIEYTNYFTHTAGALAMSAVVWGSVLALGSIAIASVTALFELDAIVNQYSLYQYWSTLVLACITPIYLISYLPRTVDINKQSYDGNKFFSFLIRYIALSFIVIYFIILYVYTIKVLLNFSDWPKGIISWMVIGFSTFGYLIYIFSKAYEKTSPWIAFVRRIFPFAVPLQVLMLGYAIYLRIAQYDLTINRYFVVIFGVWLACISLYYILSTKKSLIIITFSLSVIALFVSVGPWSVYQLPISRQYTRLLENLETAGMYREGIILKKTTPLDASLENSLYSWIEYLCNNTDCDTIETLFANFLTEKKIASEKAWNENTYNAGKKYPGMDSWAIINEVTNALWIIQRQSEALEQNQPYITLGIRQNFPESIFPIDVTGYNDIVRIYTSQQWSPYEKNTPSIVNTQTNIWVMIDANTQKLSLIINGTEIGTISLMDWDDTLAAKHTRDTFELSPQELTKMVTIGNFDIKLFFENYSFRNKQFDGKYTDSWYYQNISGYALIKRK